MNGQQKIDFKKKLQQSCISIIEKRIASCYHSMENAQDAANNEEKSSAGDKYETGRAMGHLEKDMFAKQWVTNKKDLAALLTINCDTIYQSATAGSVVKCSEFSFFIAAGLGKILIEEEPFFFVIALCSDCNFIKQKKSRRQNIIQ